MDCPVVLEHSAYLSHYSTANEHNISIDLLPNYKAEDLDRMFQQGTKDNGNKLVKSILIDIFPKNFCSKLLHVIGIDESMKLAELSKKDRNKLLNSIKNLTLTMNGFRPIKEAIITSGGVSTKEIDNKTMESKLVKGLYFAGEVMDLDALTGGYNLQIAFSTGYVAGANA